MADTRFTQLIPWPFLRQHLEHQQKATDAKLRRAVEPEAAVLRGRAVILEELMNLPETLQTLADQDEADGKEKLYTDRTGQVFNFK